MTWTRIVSSSCRSSKRSKSSAKLRPRNTGVTKNEIEEATKWVGGLDRIDRARGILACYDFSATPFAPSGKRSSEEALFGWIVSDFGLNDAIESGLVKTPRVRSSRWPRSWTLTRANQASASRM